MSTKAKKTAKTEKPAKAAKAEKAAAPKKGAKGALAESAAALGKASETSLSAKAEGDEEEGDEEEASSGASSGGGNAAALAAATGSTEMSASFKNFRHHPDMENFYRFIYENDLRLEALAIIDEMMQQRAARKEIRAARKQAH